MTLEEALHLYLQRVSVNKKGYVQEKYRINSISRYEIASKALNEIESYDIAYYRDLRLSSTNRVTGKTISPTTVRAELELLSHLYEVARVDWGADIPTNPVKSIKKPKPAPGRNRRLIKREESRIIRYAKSYSNKDFLPIITIALETAMRQGEILSLTWNRIDLNRRIVHLTDTKNGEDRLVPITLKAKRTFLELQPKSSGKVFEFSSNGLKSAWRKMVQKLGIQDLKFHDLRHEATSRLFEVYGFEALEAQAITGHKSLQMLQRYTHLNAHKLVKKLDKNRHQSRRFLLQKFDSYPIFLKKRYRRFYVTIPDFSCCLPSNYTTKEESIHEARYYLSYLLVRTINLNLEFPFPNAFSSSFEGEKVFVNPLH